MYENNPSTATANTAAQPARERGDYGRGSAATAEPTTTTTGPFSSCCPATATATPTTTTTNTVPQLLAVSSSVAEAASAANSNDRDVALTGVVQLRRLLCSEKPPIDEVIAAGLLPRLGQFLSLSDNPNFQVEALWALTNICTGSTKQIEEVLKCGIVPQLIALLSSSPDVDVCQQATWALSNILGDCAVHRDSVLRLGFFPVLLKAIVKFPNKVFFLRKATEAISNGCRGVPPPDISYFRSPNDAGESVSPLPVLAALLQYLDAEVVTHACWALSYMAESPLCIKLIISTGTIIPSLTRLLSISDTNIQRPALRALGNVANGSTEEAQSLIDAGIFQAVMPFLLQPSKCRQIVLWVLSNLAVGTKEQVTELCKSGVIPHVVTCLSSPKGDVCIREEACWVIANCIETNHPEVIQYMISLGILTPLVELLVSEDRPTTLILVLEALQRILATDRGSPNKLWASYDSLAESVSDLQSHQCTTVVSLATRLLEKYDPEKVVEDAGSYDGAERMDTE